MWERDGWAHCLLACLEQAALQPTMEGRLHLPARQHRSAVLPASQPRVPGPLALPHGQRRWWDGIPAASQLHPGHLCPPAVACPSCPCPSELAIRMVPSTPLAVQIDRQPHQGTLLLGMATPLFRSRGTSLTVPCAACTARTAAPARSHPLPGRGGEYQQGGGEGCFCASLFSKSSWLAFGHSFCLDVVTDALHLLLGSSWRGEGSSHQQPSEDRGIPFAPSCLSPYFWSFRDDPRFVF